MFSVTEGLLIAVLSAHLVLLFFIAWRIALYIRRARRLVIAITGKMDCDELIDELLSEQRQGAGGSQAPPQAGETAATQGQEEPVLGPTQEQKHRERLAALAVGAKPGNMDVGKSLTADQIDTLDDSEVERLYARYEARPGAMMTKTLGSAALQLYAGVESMFLPIPVENQSGPIRDLESDPFVGYALSTAVCELYHRFGMFLAPVTAVLTTMKHAQFGYVSS